MLSYSIISYQSLIANYNYSIYLVAITLIISYQSLIANYNVFLRKAFQKKIISYQSLIANYNIVKDISKKINNYIISKFNSKL